ncbi:MAG: FtsQ-type POTRA domain-containing protein [Pyrinomonadaceae bacterium]|nr:FtsQ-type POTRA domain-containing protein [Blastocatellia bacterium]MCW5958124.1 FtsQ-type POTRA domain-containing protein [Pyrinomonadaceae bacterium]
MAKKGKRPTARSRSKRGEKELTRVKKRGGRRSVLDVLGDKVVPLSIGAVIIVCLALVVFVTYDSVSASNFFVLKTIEVNGTDRASRSDIEKIVRSNAELPGVWNADLLEIKQKIEKVTFVKTAAVTRDLPNGIRVKINERTPVAIVKLGGKDFLADGEGEILAPAETSEKNLPFAMLGWNEEKSERAHKENLERLKVYQKMIAEWRDYDLASRVRSVDLADLREPKATLEDSGLPVTIMLGREGFGQQLSNGIKAIVGKGNMFEGVNLVGQNMVLVPRKQR